MLQCFVVNVSKFVEIFENEAPRPSSVVTIKTITNGVE